MKNKKLYFAYGANLDLEHMKKLCPEHKFLKIVFLKDYEFVYDCYSFDYHIAEANIIPKKGKVVWGVLYEISTKDEKNLDKYEEYPEEYKKDKVLVCDENGHTYEALVYLRNYKKSGKPLNDYKNKIISAAKKLKFPAKYIKEYLER